MSLNYFDRAGLETSPIPDDPMSSALVLKRPRRPSDIDEHAPKRMRGGQARKKLTHDHYSFGWVAALPEEQAAARAMLDEMHQDLPQKEGDINIYTLGRIGEHNIVIAGLPANRYGTVNAATVATNMHRTFPSLQDYLMVGIAGGAGNAHNVDVRLGDIVVSDTVIQYDLGKAHDQGHFETTAVPLQPSQRLEVAISRLKTSHLEEPSEIPGFIRQIAKKRPQMKNFASRESLKDLLFEDTYEHSGSNDNCDKCDPSKLVNRKSRDNDDPKIHYGTIASGNTLVKSSEKRKELVDRFKALCFEMEGAGFIKSLQCLVIRSICDYADSHKNKQWQPYAAAAAAAYAKELILVMPISEDQASMMVREKLSSNQKKNLMDSLSFETIVSREMNIEPPLGATCEWILHHPDYQAWLDPGEYSQHHGFIWIRGKPGAGKSTLMKFIYTNLKSTHNALSFFFNARGDKLEKSTEGMYRSLLLQLFQKFEDLQKVLDDRLLHEVSKGRLKWDNGTLQDLFMKAISQLGQRELICFVDALDECNEAEVYDMVEYFERLGEYALKKDLRFFVCLSSRHYPSISLKAGLTLTLEYQDGHSRDLKEYVSHKLNVGKGHDAQEIRSALFLKADGVFMWVVLVVNMLNKEYQRGRIFAVKKKLNEIPNKLGELFKEILKRDGENLDELLLALQWILYSREPLTPEEYYYALQAGFDSEERDLAEWNPEVVTLDHMRRFVSTSSKGLAEVTRSDYPKVQFIHESVRDFLIKDGGISELWPNLPHDFESHSHDRLKECCLVYIEAQSSNAERLPEQLDYEQKWNFMARFPFFYWAINSVIYHSRKAATSFPQQRFFESFDFTLWFRLCDQDMGPALCEDLCYILTYDDIEHGHSEENDCSTYAASDTACNQEVNAHLSPENDCPENYNQGPRLDLSGLSFFGGFTPLHVAVDWSHTELARLLLDRGANVSAADNSGRTPLYIAAEYGDQENIKLLLAHSADVSAADNNGQTPLHIAAEYGKQESIELLLAYGANVSAADNNGQTPLHIAAEDETQENIKLLLAHGANVSAADNNGQIPLHIAAKSRNKENIKLLLAHGANVSAANNNGQTPLHIAAAAKYRNRENIKLLLAHGANLSTADNNGQTPLHIAAKYRDQKNTKLLLAHSANISAADNNGRIPLYIAAKYRDQKNTKLLLAHSANVSAADNNGRTPLHIAAKYGNPKNIELLLAHGAKVNISDYYGMTPSQLASRSGHVGIAMLLQSYNSQSPSLSSSA